MADEAADAPPAEDAPVPEEGSAEAAAEPAVEGDAAADPDAAGASGEAAAEEGDPSSAAPAEEAQGDDAAPAADTTPPVDGGEAAPQDPEQGATEEGTAVEATDNPPAEGDEAPPVDGEAPAEEGQPAAETGEQTEEGAVAAVAEDGTGDAVAAEGEAAGDAVAPDADAAVEAVEGECPESPGEGEEEGEGEGKTGSKKKRKKKRKSADAEDEDGEEESGSEEEDGDEEGSFLEDDEFDDELRSEFEEEEDDKPDPILEWKAKEEELFELNEKAMQDNIQLTRRVIQWKMQKDKTTEASEKPSEGKVTEHKYQNRLNEVHTTRMKLRMQQVKAARMNEELIGQLDVKRSMAIECRDSFQNFKQQIARFAEYARTGKRIPEKILREVEEFELDKDAEVEDVRGRQISLKNRLAKLEQQLRKKDELAEDLHVIDFEHLKIENQTLNEKIEVRNEELHKLRKKTIVTVQIITHMREKVQFVSQEFQALKAELGQLDQDLAAQRDLVAKTKHERDDYRSDITKQRQQTGLVNSESLTKDFEKRQGHIKQLEQDLTNLKQKYAQLTTYIQRNTPKN